ncbi:putative PEP-binding protein [Nonomuraea sp. NPDC048892]|uniref:putative PEP-binding protein n=1 Tax=Nonomuraea sp. NPDC048892 TaxID=3154624 RepID=UPI0033F6CF37
MSSAKMLKAAHMLAQNDPIEAIRAAAYRAMVPEGVAAACTGMGVTADCASGVLCTTIEECATAELACTPYVYARPATGAADMRAVRESMALFTATGGTTSHAAVLARSWQKPCVVGAGFSLREGTLTLQNGSVLRSGEWVTVCATTGSVWRGELKRYRDPHASGVLQALIDAADELHELPGPVVYANAETDEEVVRCIALGAEGVGVARTEHMFFGDTELPLLRRALWPKDSVDHVEALASLHDLLAAKCLSLMRACAGRRLAIRLLDPPAHEFADPETLLLVREENPMMGVRGARLGILHSDIYRTQAQAIIQAHLNLPPDRRSYLAVLLPFVTFGAEVSALREILDVPSDSGIMLGAMIETPEAVFRSPEIANEVDFLSVGTNDLLQFCLAMSRDDVASALIPTYIAEKLVDDDPVTHLDRSASAIGLLRLMTDLTPGVPWGICGEHAADSSSLRALLPLDPAYVSVSAAGMVCTRVEIGRHRAIQFLRNEQSR